LSPITLDFDAYFKISRKGASTLFDSRTEYPKHKNRHIGGGKGTFFDAFFFTSVLK